MVAGTRVGEVRAVRSTGQSLNKWVVEKWCVRKPRVRRIKNISIFKDTFNLNGEALENYINCLLRVRKE